MSKTGMIQYDGRWDSLTHMLDYRARTEPNRTAFIFLDDGETEGDRLTYGELRSRALILSAHLQRLGESGSRAVLQYPPGLEFVVGLFGCLYANWVPMPISSSRRPSSHRVLQAIEKSAAPALKLTVSKYFDSLHADFANNAGDQHNDWVATDRLSPLDVAITPATPIDPSKTAYLQFSSGSTGQPKGVMISHSNVLYNLAYLDQDFQHDQTSVIVSWLPTFHDLGLVYAVFQPLYSGCLAVLMAPISFAHRPIRWLNAMTRYRATHTAAPNFAYDLCVYKTTPQQRTGLDLRLWRVALNGSELVRGETMVRFSKTYAPHGFNGAAFCPSYGLAEATLKVSTVRHSDPFAIVNTASGGRGDELDLVRASHAGRAVQFVGCGVAGYGTTVRIVDPATRKMCQAGSVGEIWVSGPGVALGYWDKPTETLNTFGSYIVDTNDGPFLRTGDLGFKIGDQLFVAGRIKDLIIIRGRNHHPEDIEFTIQHRHPDFATGACAAFSAEHVDREKVIILKEVARSKMTCVDYEGLATLIRCALSEEHDLTVDCIMLLKTGGLPKTSSGKVARTACKEAFLAGALDSVSLWRWCAPIQVKLNAPTENYDVAKCGHSLVEPGHQMKRNASGNSYEPLGCNQSDLQTDRLLDWLRGYAEKRLNSTVTDERRCIPPYVILDFGLKGLLGMQVPTAYGGLQLSNANTMKVFEQLAAIDLTLAAFVGVQNCLGIRPILNFAQKRRREDVLPIIAQGRQLVAFALSEPNAGSYVHAITSVAVPNSEGKWSISGEKVWVGSGSWAGYVNVFVQLLDKQGCQMGITGFTLPHDRSGIRMGQEALTMGMRGMVQNSIYLEDVGARHEDLLGGVGNGMTVARDAMMHARLCLAAMSVGAMKRCAQLLLRYGQRRHISSGRLIDNGIVREALEEMTSAIMCVECLVMRIAELLDAEKQVLPEGYAACKTLGPELLWHSVDALMQLCGGRGYIETNGVARLFRDARVLRIFEGPTENMAVFLGSRLVRSNKELYAFLADGFRSREACKYLDELILIMDSHTNVRVNGNENRATLTDLVLLRAGEAASFIILFAACDNSLSVDWPGQQAIQWCRGRIVQCIAKTSQTIARKNIENKTSVTVHISGYARSIGDIEENLPGAGWALDPYISRVSPENGGVTVERDDKNEPDSLPIAVSEGSEERDEGNVDSLSETAIAEEILAWVASRAGIVTSHIDPQKSFADFGLDSLAAVELSKMLEDKLQTILAPTLAWNFPNIQSLAHHLAIDRARAGSGSADKVCSRRNRTSWVPKETMLKTPVTDVENKLGLSNLTTGEIAMLLTKEIENALKVSEETRNCNG